MFESWGRRKENTEMRLAAGSDSKAATVTQAAVKPHCIVERDPNVPLPEKGRLEKRTEADNLSKSQGKTCGSERPVVAVFKPGTNSKRSVMMSQG